MVAWAGMQRLRLGLAEAPLAPNDDVDLHVEVRPAADRLPRPALDDAAAAAREAEAAGARVTR